MKEHCCVFLRGINVNGINIKMAALKEAFIKMGFTDAKTILATGNVIFTLTEKNNCGQILKSYIEKELSNLFLYDAHIVMRSSKEIQNVIFVAKTMDVHEECHNYCLLFDDMELLLELKLLFDSIAHLPQEQLIIVECGVFWIVPKGATLSSNFGLKILGNKKYKSRLTSRNINTMQKIYKAMME